MVGQVTAIVTADDVADGIADLHRLPPLWHERGRGRRQSARPGLIFLHRFPRLAPRDEPDAFSGPAAAVENRHEDGVGAEQALDPDERAGSAFRGINVLADRVQLQLQRLPADDFLGFEP